MTDHVPWDECPAGLVAKMAGDLRAKRLRARLRPALAVVAILLVLGVAWGMQNRSGAAAAPLDCGQTVRLMDGYHQETLNPRLTKRVSEHLANCSSCRKHFHDQLPGEASLEADADKLVARHTGSRMLAAR